MKKSFSILAFLSILTLSIPASVSATMSDNVVPQEGQALDKNVTSSTTQLLVKFKNGVKGKSVKEVHETIGGTEEEVLGQGKSPWHLVKIPEGKVQEFKEKYKSDSNVEAVEENLMYQIDYTPNDPLLSNQWHHSTIKSYSAWDVIKGSSKTIAIIDTGIQLNHPDLQKDLVAGATFVSGTSTPNDDNGHGTHCAGLAAAIGNNGVGVSGVDETAKLMPVKVLNSQGSGYTSDIINGVYWATDHGADILSMSLGGGGSSQSFQDAINYAWNKNKIIVAAAGNSSTSSYSYPAAYNNVIAVAATDSNDSLASFSNYGKWVDIAAPGVNIYSTYKGSTYKSLSGTSMATPIVASVLALTWGKEPSYSNSQIVNRVLSTSDRTSDTGTYYNNGRINANNAVSGF